jgi:selenocysteine lyase/cysteine desulfurase
MSTTQRAHFNHAGAGIPSAAVDAAMRDYVALERELSPYEAEALHGEPVIADVRASLGRLLRCGPSSVALFDNATRAWGTLVTGVPLRPADTVWVSPYDYVGNLFVLARLRDTVGVTVEAIPLTPTGDLDLDWVDRHLTGDVAMVSVTHLPSCAGVVSDVAALGARLRGSRALLVVDGCQAVGNVDVDVTEIGCDVYTGAGRKFLSGPRGTGFATVSDRFLDRARPQVVDVHAMGVSPDLTSVTTVSSGVDLELAERNFAVWAGLRVALDEYLACADHTRQQRQKFLSLIEDTVDALPAARRLGNGSRRAGTCSVLLDGPDPTTVYRRLWDRGVNAWVGHGEHTPLFAPGEGAHEFLRISLGARTTEEETDRLIAELTAAVAA